MPKINWTGFKVALLALGILVVFMLACPRVVSGQQVVSAKAGLLHYFEGDVYVGDVADIPPTLILTEDALFLSFLTTGKTKIPQSKTKFVQLEAGQIFSTEAGRAEILLAPGMFLRVGENCEVRFLATWLYEQSIAVPRNKGNCVMVLDFLDVPKDTQFSLDYGYWRFRIQKKGIYHFSAKGLSESPELRILSGEVFVDIMEDYYGKFSKAKVLVVKEFEIEARKLEKDFSDEITRWSKRRDSYLAAANVWAAKNIFDGFTRNNWRNNSWYWNPYFGMYTFIPGRGNIDCYWGYRFFNPRGAANYYNWAGSQYTFAGGSGNQPQGGQPTPSYGYRPDLGYTVGPRGSWSNGSSSSSGVIPPQQSPRTSESASPRPGSKGRGR